MMEVEDDEALTHRLTRASAVAGAALEFGLSCFYASVIACVIVLIGSSPSFEQPK
jgi:hypothetical protein